MLADLLCFTGIALFLFGLYCWSPIAAMMVGGLLLVHVGSTFRPKPPKGQA